MRFRVYKDGIGCAFLGLTYSFRFKNIFNNIEAISSSLFQYYLIFLAVNKQVNATYESDYAFNDLVNSTPYRYVIRIPDDDCDPRSSYESAISKLEQSLQAGACNVTEFNPDGDYNHNFYWVWRLFEYYVPHADTYRYKLTLYADRTQPVRSRFSDCLKELTEKIIDPAQHMQDANKCDAEKEWKNTKILLISLGAVFGAIMLCCCSVGVYSWILRVRSGRRVGAEEDHEILLPEAADTEAPDSKVVNSGSNSHETKSKQSFLSPIEQFKALLENNPKPSVSELVNKGRSLDLTYEDILTNSNISKENLKTINENANRLGYVCIITHEIMNQPATAGDGYNYEFAAVNKWRKMSGAKSPYLNIANNDFKNTKPIINRSMGLAIKQFVGDAIKSYSKGYADESKCDDDLKKQPRLSP